MLPKLKTSVPGPKSKKLTKELQKTECSNTTFVSKDFPIFIEKSKGQNAFDVDGNCYLDFTSFFAVSNIGHSHPKIQKLITKQVKEGWHAMGDVYPHIKKLEAQKALLKLLPSSLNQVIFSSSGSEAVETALKTAFIKTKKRGVLAFKGAYHGLGYGSMLATHREYFRKPFESQVKSFVTFFDFVEENSHSTGYIQRKLKEVSRIIKTKSIGAILIEPIQGRGGIRVSDKRFLKGLRDICRKKGVLLIFDEIFSGFGRTGKWFGFEHFKVTPDILCLGKGIANGFPISCCVSSKKVFDSWGKSKGEAKHTSTFLGNPLGCSMILSTIDILKKEKLILQSKKMGGYFEKKLTSLKEEGVINFYRGRGLMIGVGLGGKNKASTVMKSLLKQGVIILPSGEKSEILSLTPPFTVTKKQIDYFIKTLRLVLK